MVFKYSETPYYTTLHYICVLYAAFPFLDLTYGQVVSRTADVP